MNDDQLRRYAILLTAVATVILALVLLSFFFCFTSSVNAVNVNVNASAPAKWIEKCFYYDIDNQYWSYPPVVGLDVTFGTEGRPLWTKTTDVTGCVMFGSGLPDGTYHMDWNWGGEPYYEEFTINCSKLIWEYENYLPAKGSGVLV